MATNFPTSLDDDITIAASRVQGSGRRDAHLENLVAAVKALETDVGITGAAKRKQTARSQTFNLDNGAGTTIDDVIMKLPFAVTLRAARIVYVGATTGTVAAGNAKLGTTVGGAELVAATAYEDTKAIGVATAMVVITAAAVNVLAANQAVHVRHTGVAITQAGEAYVEIDYTIN